MGHACIVWYNKLDSQKSSKIFNRISKVICSYICCTFKSMNTRTIETILGVQPIKHYIQEKALNTAVRLKANEDWTDTDGHTVNMHSITINKHLHENQIHINKPRDEMKQNTITEPKYKTSIINKEEWLKTVLLEVTPSNQYTVNIYTDGSRNQDGNAGSGYITKCKDRNYRIQNSHHLGNNISVYQSELYAVIYVSHELLKKEPIGMKLNYHIDNQSVIKNLQNPMTKSTLVLEAKDLLNKLATFNDIYLNYIPAHTGQKGNEIADRLAKLGASNTNTNLIAPVLPVMKNQYREQVRKAVRGYQNEEWKKRVRGRVTKIFFPNTESHKNEKIINLPKGKLSKLIQCLTGHVHLNKQLYRLKKWESPKCKCEEEDESADHFLLQCPLYARQRWQTMGMAFVPPSMAPSIKLDKI